MKLASVFFKMVALAALLGCTITAAAVTAPQKPKNEYQYSLTKKVKGIIFFFQSSSKRAVDKAPSKQKRHFRFATPLKQALNAFFAVPKPKRFHEPGRNQAIAGLVLGIIGIQLFIIPVFPLLAIILGSVSLKKYKEGYHDKRGMARAACILGFIGLGLFLFYAAIFFLPFFIGF